MGREEIEKITEYIFLESKLQKVDLALVFGTRHMETVNKVYELYGKGFVPKILVSGGLNKITSQNEAQEMSQNLVDLGVAKGDIILEDQSTNTLENVLFSKVVIEKTFGFENIKKILIVTKHYHARRAMMTLKKHFPENIEIIPVTYEVYRFNKDNWFETEKGKEKVLSEMEKIKKYLEKGDLEDM